MGRRFYYTRLIDRRWAVVDVVNRENGAARLVHTYKPSQKVLAVAMCDKLNGAHS